MKIKSNIKNYSIEMKEGFQSIDDLFALENTFFVVDKKVHELYKDNVLKNIPFEKMKIIEATENNKTIETALQVCEAMISIPAKRNARLVSFGGGVIQDITGFAANILYRGIHWTFIPTTLLAACDSCIGGKTSLNFKTYKNLLGTFYPPEQILIFPAFFKTLTESDFKSGLGEVVKFNLMNGESGLVKLEEEMELLLQRDESTLIKYIETSLGFKKPFVEKDEFDLGIRVHLNFAHTFGHAIETTSNYLIPHGTAVAMGMIMANRISLRRGILGEAYVSRAENILRMIIDKSHNRIGMNPDFMIDAIHNDKKQTSSNITAILMNGEMQLTVVSDIKRTEISEALEALYECLSKESNSNQ